MTPLFLLLTLVATPVAGDRPPRWQSLPAPVVVYIPDPVADLVMIRSRELGLHETSWAEADRLSHAVQMESGHPPVEILLAVDEVESKYDPFSRSRAGGRGIPQILPDTWRRWAPRAGVDLKDYRDLEAQTHVQATYLRWLYARYGSWRSALTAYHLGPDAFERRGRRQDGYSRLVMGRARLLYHRLHPEEQ